MAQKPAPFTSVRSDINLPAQEQEILALWEREKIFEKTLSSKTAEGAERKTYSFYDGPPFATGLPHYGHLLAGVLKDIVPRYWTMKGYRVPRRFGWDCHGLPVEYEINKAHKLESRKQILETLGVAQYNALCRSIVDRYSNEWKATVKRSGRWVDMDHAYFTMDVSFMQSVWWVFKQLWDKGLIYEGHKVVPYSTGLSTALSNFEANLNYKNVQDPAVTVGFPLLRDEKTQILAWTTTPWTLPSNMALAVGVDFDYVTFKSNQSNDTAYIVAEARLDDVLKSIGLSRDQVTLTHTVKGSVLVGETYAPLFDYFAGHEKKGAFRVIPSAHVTTDSGTGIVHMAPAYGEEDYFACQSAGVPLVNPVDDDGMFTAEVPDHQGKRVKDADRDLIAQIKAKGRLFKHDTLTHSYPFCWRTDTPLIYRAVSSWFVNVEKIKDSLLKANATTQWVPDHLRDGRFGNWLENARDWAISRNRFWGTPIPIWSNPEGERICVGSKAELEELTGKTVHDLHMEHLDQLEIPSPTGRTPLKRIEPVLDCWFESGSMPYAQWGYPEQNKNEFEAAFPADFIAEGLDQTRGWFYTLMVIGTALYGKAPFKNVVVNGLILAEDGKKMSKSLRNYPDPNEVLDRHGADALRLYLIDSPVVKAQELRFSETGVRDVVRRILLRWWNSYSFFINYANIDGFTPKGDAVKSPNLLDQWVLSRLHTLLAKTQTEMEAYRLYNVVPGLLGFIEELTNTYIRFNRSHFWQDGMPEDKRLAYETLHEVLLTLSKVMAPFAPFLAETTYQNLAQVSPAKLSSVHLETFPISNPKLIHPELEEAVQSMDALVTLGRNHRERIQVKAKIPLIRLTVIHRKADVLENLKRFEPYFKDELNVREVLYTSNEADYVSITAKANFPVLGKRVGSKMKLLSAAIQKLSLEQILSLEGGGSLTLEDETLSLSDVEIRRESKGNNPNLSTHALVSIEMDPTVTPEQVREGLAREVIRKIQAARKAADFALDDRIRLEIHASGDLRSAVDAHRELITSETLTKEFAWSDAPTGQHTETHEIDGDRLSLGVRRMTRLGSA